MPNKIVKHCKRCKKEQTHRLQGKLRPFMRCVVCAESSSKAHRHANWFRYLAQKANARKRADSDKLAEADILAVWEKQNRRCGISGRYLDVKSKWWKPSLDRIDNSKGYTKDNIRVIAWVINHCRGDLTSSEFYEMCVACVVKDLPAFGFTVGYWD